MLPPGPTELDTKVVCCPWERGYKPHSSLPEKAPRERVALNAPGPACRGNTRSFAPVKSRPEPRGAAPVPAVIFAFFMFQ